MAEHNGHVPIIGSQKPRMSSGIQALVRQLDGMGTFEADRVIATPQGNVPVPGRGDYVDAEELVEMIRQVVREEIRAALTAAAQ